MLKVSIAHSNELTESEKTALSLITELCDHLHVFNQIDSFGDSKDHSSFTRIGIHHGSQGYLTRLILEKSKRRISIFVQNPIHAYIEATPASSEDRGNKLLICGMEIVDNGDIKVYQQNSKDPKTPQLKHVCFSGFSEKLSS